MLEVNEYVVYGHNGVCFVEDCRIEKFGGEARRYYILKPVSNEDSTLYVPVDNDDLMEKMKDILTKKEIMTIIHSLPEDELEWIEESKSRSSSYDDIFARGSRRELLLMIKSIYKKKKERKAEGKKLWTMDDNAMKKAEQLVYEEFATVLGIEPNQVVRFIQDEIDRADEEVSKN